MWYSSRRNSSLPHVSTALKVINLVGLFYKVIFSSLTSRYFSKTWVRLTSIKISREVSVSSSSFKGPWELTFLFSSLFSFLSGFYWSLQKIESFLFPVKKLEAWSACYQWSKRTLYAFRKLFNHISQIFNAQTQVSVSVFCIKEKDILINFYWLLFYS